MPLLALGVDFSRVELMRVKLRSATTAACQAYANSLDIAKFRDNDELVFTKGSENAGRVFFEALGDGASFVPSEYRDTGKDVPLDGVVVRKIVIQCTGTAIVDAMVPFWGNYSITSFASAKTKFSTSR